jgi:hypothetical protein
MAGTLGLGLGLSFPQVKQGDELPSDLPREGMASPRGLQTGRPQPPSPRLLLNSAALEDMGAIGSYPPCFRAESRGRRWPAATWGPARAFS